MFQESTAHGMEVRLKPKGTGRFAGAAFLGVWLCGWAVGEVVALGALAQMVYTLITGNTGPIEISGGGVLAALFLLVWLIGWTFGGILAMRQFFQSVWAEDRLIAAGYGLIIRRQLGPFRSKREIARTELKSIRYVVGTGKLVADTDSGPVELSALGTADEKERAAATLSEYLGLSVEPDTDGPVDLPAGWETVVTSLGDKVLIKDPGRRRRSATAVLVLALLAAGVTTLLIVDSMDNASLIAVAAVAGLVAAALCYGSYALYRKRDEWVFGSGTFQLRKRHGTRVRDVFRAKAIELTVSSDNDGDRWYKLEAVRSTETDRRKIHQVMRDPSEVQQLGRWIEQRTRLDFTDRTLEDKTRTFEDLKRQLENQGRLGRWVAKLIERTQARRARGSAVD